MSDSKQTSLWKNSLIRLAGGALPLATAPQSTGERTRPLPLDRFNQTLLWFAALTILCIGLVLVTRLNALTVIAISMLIPAALLGAKLLRFVSPRIKQLFLIESVYMAVAALAILSIVLGWDSMNGVAGIAFFAFFLLQVTGFVVDQATKKSWLGVASSSLFGAAILLWGLSASWQSTIDSDGRFLMWGENAPLLIQVVYALWVIDVFVGSKALPKLTEASAHTVSIVIAMLSGQFFFARLLTASQLFMLEGLTRYSQRDFVSPDFMTVREGSLARFQKFYRRYVSKTVFATLCLLVALSCTESLGDLGVL